jgi:polyisoprenoid-binding protein YceI
MFRTFAFLALLLFVPVSAMAEEAPAWTIDPAHSSVTFSVRHIFTPVYGSFSSVSGTLRFDPRNLAGSSVDVRIPIATINTRVDRRDSHLKSADFFDAAQYPEMTFVSRKFTRAGRNSYRIMGDLTIRGVTKRVTIPFRLLGTKAHPMRENHRVTGATAKFMIKRNDFGVGSGQWAETAVVGDEVWIKLAIEAYRPDTPAAQ